MESIDSAVRTEVMPGLPCVELIKRQRILALLDLNISQIRRHSYRPTHTTIRAIAATRGSQAVTKPHVKTDRATVTGGFVNGAGIRIGFSIMEGLSKQQARLFE